MSTNALWSIRYVDKANPDGYPQSLLLCSTDLANPKKATRRAADTAKARLLKKGVKARIISVECVG